MEIGLDKPMLVYSTLAEQDSTERQRLLGAIGNGLWKHQFLPSVNYFKWILMESQGSKRSYPEKMRL